MAAAVVVARQGLEERPGVGPPRQLGPEIGPVVERALDLLADVVGVGHTSGATSPPE